MVHGLLEKIHGFDYRGALSVIRRLTQKDGVKARLRIKLAGEPQSGGQDAPKAC